MTPEEKLLHSSKTDSVEYIIDSLADLSKGSLFETIDKEIPPEVLGEERHKIRVAVVLEDLDLFLKIKAGLNKHSGVTVADKESGKVMLSAEVTRKLELIVPRIKKFIAFLREQPLNPKDIETVDLAEKAIVVVEIYATST